jgi:hypothetical protein
MSFCRVFHGLLLKKHLLQLDMYQFENYFISTELSTELSTIHNSMVGGRRRAHAELQQRFQRASAKRRANERIVQLLLCSTNGRELFTGAPKFLRNRVEYLLLKAKYPELHAKCHGGVRNVVYSSCDISHICATLWFVVKRFPQLRFVALFIIFQFANFGFLCVFHRLWEYHSIVQQLTGLDVKLWFIQRIFFDWRWSFKIAGVYQIRKYTQENIVSYIDFFMWLNSIEHSRVKFLDEVNLMLLFLFILHLNMLLLQKQGHFVSKNLLRTRAVSEYNERVIAVQDHPGLDFRCTVSVMVCLDDAENPVHATMTEGPNDGISFTLFVLSLIDSGALGHGDFLCLGEW